MTNPPYDVIIGLEVHVQLRTNTKLFCRCSTEFGNPPNTQTCPVCLGLPGALPVMNRKAYELSVKTALALNCNIPNFTKWDRKQYYYPDLPKGYQISQFDLPMSENGYLAISSPDREFEDKNVGIIRAHLEEDAGKSMHDEAQGLADTRIDLNRTGTPLLEIVSEPDMRSAEEARAYLQELRLLLTYLDVSDCNMQEGSLRVDANVNLHVHTETDEKIATPIVEVKNMNSFRAVERALHYEVKRQYEIWQETGNRIGDVPKQTRGWDDNAQLTRAQREKEESSDYRYFPDPDLVPVTITNEQVEAFRQQIPELPAALREKLVDEFSLTPYTADVIVNQGPEVVANFQSLAQHTGDSKQSGNWVQGEVLRVLKEEDWELSEFPISAEGLADLLKAIQQGELNNSRGKEVFSEMLSAGTSAADAMAALGIEKVDDSALEDLCREIVMANPKVISDVQSGNEKAVGALIGQAKQKNPNVNPGQVRQICLDIINAL